MQSECQRHKAFPMEYSGDEYKPYILVKCTHIGQRFVVHIKDGNPDRRDEYHTVDYVSDEGSDVQVLVATDYNTLAEANAAYDELVQRMRFDLASD